MYFRDIAGQEALKKRLVQTVKDNRVSHAWFFFGQEGSGTLPLAIALARYMLCTGQGDKDACGICPGCKKTDKYIHPDLHFVYPVNKTRSVDKDEVVGDDFAAEWRKFLLDQPYGRLTDWYDFIGLENKQGAISTAESRRLTAKLNLKSFESDYKVVVIWQPDKMHDQAASRLLKLLEEPPPMTLYILAGENPDGLLSTIKSRCVQVKVPRIADEELAEILMQKHGLTGEKAALTIRLASGNYLKALELMEPDEDSSYNFTHFRDLMRISYTAKIPEMIRISEEIAVLTREKQKSFLEYGLRAIRECMAVHYSSPDIVYVSEEERKFIYDFAPYITGRNILGVTHEITRAIVDIERNGNGRIILLDLVLSLSGLIKS